MNEYPLWLWIGFGIFVLLMLSLDLGIFNRTPHTPSYRETFIWSIIWIALAFAFNALVLWQFGAEKGKLFFLGYVIELSLSIDNLFVFLLIFNFFKVPAKYQHRVLFWGIFAALILRMIMIFAGAELVERAEWILYIFGAFLVYTGFKMFFGEDDSFNPEESSIVSLTTRLIPISKTFDGDNFFVNKDGKTFGTLLLLVLIVINVADVVFAVDSIPAIFGITTDRFIIYTSNIFAILGLRTFFFLLVKLAEKFHYLKFGLAFVLSFIGVKMLLPLVTEIIIWLAGSRESAIIEFAHRFLNREFDNLFMNISLGIIISALLLSIAVSLIFPPTKQNES